MRKSRRSRPPRHGRDVRSMCVVRRRGVTAPRRLVGDGVYWDRLRVGGRVWGATCAAPRKIDDAPPARPRRAAAASLITTRDAPPSAGPPPQPLDGRAAPPRRAAAPRRAPPSTGQGASHGYVFRCWRRRGPARPPPARSQQSGYTLGPLRTRSVGLEPRAVRFGRVALPQKSASGRCAAPARRPQKPAGTLRLDLLRP